MYERSPRKGIGVDRLTEIHDLLAREEIGTEASYANQVSHGDRDGHASSGRL